MLSTSLSDVGAAKAATAIPQSQTIHPDKLYPPKTTAEILNMSTSRLAKARLRGDGSRYVKFGRSVKYQGSTSSNIANRRSAKRQAKKEGGSAHSPSQR